jgi:hypothetical protein
MALTAAATALRTEASCAAAAARLAPWEAAAALLLAAVALAMGCPVA